MAIYKRANPNRPETVDPTDLPLTPEEALACANQLSRWPGGLGEALVPCDKSKRGWKRDPNFCHFKPYAPSDDVLLCPVMLIKKLRCWEFGNYAKHLSAFRSLRNAYAEILGVDLKTARLTYNEHLKHSPKVLIENLKLYATSKLGEQYATQ